MVATAQPLGQFARPLPWPIGGWRLPAKMRGKPRGTVGPRFAGLPRMKTWASWNPSCFVPEGPLLDDDGLGNLKGRFFLEGVQFGL